MFYVWLSWCIVSSIIIGWCCAKLSIGWNSFFIAITLFILSCLLFYHVYLNISSPSEDFSYTYRTIHGDGDPLNLMIREYLGQLEKNFISRAIYFLRFICVRISPYIKLILNICFYYKGLATNLYNRTLFSVTIQKTFRLYIYNRIIK